MFKPTQLPMAEYAKCGTCTQNTISEAYTKIQNSTYTKYMCISKAAQNFMPLCMQYLVDNCNALQTEQ